MNAPAQALASDAQPRSARLGLRIGRARKLVEVESYAEASRLYAALRDQSGYGASRMPEGRIYDAATNQLVARLSYNGRIWAGERCIFDPFGTEAAT